MKNVIAKLKASKVKLDRLKPLGAKLQGAQIDIKKIILIFLVLGIIGYMDYTFLIKEQLSSLRRLNPKVVRLKEDLNTLIKNFNEMKRLEKQTDGKQTQERKEFICAEERVSLLQNISRLARENSVQIVQMMPSKEKQSAQQPFKIKNLKPMFVNLDLFCDYHHLGAFINQLENANIFIAAERINIVPQEKDFYRQKVDLVLKTYVKE